MSAVTTTDPSTERRDEKLLTGADGVAPAGNLADDRVTGPAAAIGGVLRRVGHRIGAAALAQQLEGEGTPAKGHRIDGAARNSIPGGKIITPSSGTVNPAAPSAAAVSSSQSPSPAASSSTPAPQQQPQPQNPAAGTPAQNQGLGNGNNPPVQPTGLGQVGGHGWFRKINSFNPRDFIRDHFIRGVSVIGGVAGFAVTTVAVTWAAVNLGQHFAGLEGAKAFARVGPFVGMAAGFYVGGMLFRGAFGAVRQYFYDMTIGKLQQRKVSFDDPDQMYEGLKLVRDFIGKTLRISKEDIQKIDDIIEQKDKAKEWRAWLDKEIDGLNVTDNVKEFLKTRSFDLTKDPRALFADALNKLGASQDSQAKTLLAEIHGGLAPGSAEKIKLEGIFDESLRRQAALMKFSDKHVSEIRGDLMQLQVDPELTKRLAMLFKPGSFSSSLAGFRVTAGNLRARGPKSPEEKELVDTLELLEAQIDRDSKKRAEMDKILAKDDAAKPALDAESKDILNRIRDVLKEMDRGRYRLFGIIPLWQVKTMGLNFEERKDFEGKYKDRPRLIPFKMPYTSQRFNYRLWGIEEFDQAKYFETTVIGLKNIYEQKDVFKGVGKLTQSQIKSLIASEFGEIPLTSYKRELRPGVETVIEALNNQLVNFRYKWLALTDNTFTKILFAKSTGAVVAATVIMGPTASNILLGSREVLFMRMAPAVQFFEQTAGHLIKGLF